MPPPNSAKPGENIKSGALSTEVDPYESLTDERYKQAIELRLRNVSYKDISATLKTPYKTVTWWFEVDGPCRKAWDYLIKIRSEDRIKRRAEMDDQINELSADALIVLSRIVRGEEKAGAVAKVTAAAKILDLAGYAPPIKVEQTESEELKLFKELISQNERILKSKQGSGADIQGRRGADRLDTKAKGNR